MSNGLNSGYIATDQRRAQAGSYDGRKHYLERLRGSFLDENAIWTPAQIATSLWLDASDSSRITSSLFGSNLLVYNWRDKSGNNRHISQSITTSQPYYITASWGTGLSIIDFDGTNDFLSGSVAISNIVTTTAYTSFVVGMVLDVTVGPSPTRPDLANGIYSDTQGYMGLFVSRSGVGGAPVIGAYNYTASAIATADIVTASYTLGTATIINVELGGGNLQLRLDGGTPTSVVTEPLFTVANYMQVGRNYNTPNYSINGEIGEVLFITGALSQANRERVEGYLAWKWGLVSNLAANHPYKNEPPLK